LTHTRCSHRCDHVYFELHQLYINFAVHRDYSSPDRTGSTSASPCTASARLPAIAALHRLRRASRLLVSGCTHSTSTSPCAATTRLRPHALYVNLTVRRDYSSPGRTGSTSTLPCAAGTRLSTAAALHRLRCTPPRRRLLGARLIRLLISTGFN
jgi:hypothetical protein